MAELAPTPTASVRIATVVKAGFFLSMRKAYFKSCRNVCIVSVLRGSLRSQSCPGSTNEAALLLNTAAARVVAKNLCSRSQFVTLNIEGLIVVTWREIQLAFS